MHYTYINPPIDCLYPIEYFLLPERSLLMPSISIPIKPCSIVSEPTVTMSIDLSQSNDHECCLAIDKQIYYVDIDELANMVALFRMYMRD